MFALYFLFILVMTHALMQHPFSGPGYYDHKFFKLGKRRPVHHKMPLIGYPWINPVILQNKMIPKVPVKGFGFGYPLWNTNYLSTYQNPISSFGPVFDFSSKGVPYFDIIIKGNPHFDTPTLTDNSYSFFKSSSIPFPVETKEPVIKASKRYPKIYKISFAKTKPKILFLKKTSATVLEQKEFIPVKVDFVDRSKPLSNENLVTIDNVKTDTKPPAKDMKPRNDVGHFDIISVPLTEITDPNDVPVDSAFDIPKLDVSNPNNGKNLIKDIPIEVNVDVKVTDIPASNVNLVIGSSPTDLKVKEPKEKGNNKDLTVIPITSTDGKNVVNLNSAALVTVGDIPGFIVDGGNSVDIQSNPIYVTNEIPNGELGAVVIDSNGDLKRTPKHTDLLTGNIGIDLTSNEIFPASSTEGNDFSFGGILGSNLFLGSHGMANTGVRSELLVDGNAGINGHSENALIDIQKDQNVIGSKVTDGIQPSESELIDTSQTNEISSEIIPLGNSGDRSLDPVSSSAKLESVSSTEDEINNHGIGSVVIIRPVSFLMDVEPFGPGPYGQCRAPARVVCGARFGWEHVTGMAEWCQSNCIVFMYSSYCDDDRCQCKCV